MAITETKKDALTQNLEGLCQQILELDEVKQAQQQLEAFLQDRPARELWQQFEQVAGSLQQRQQAGETLPKEDTDLYEELREKLNENELVGGFMQARQVLGGVQQKAMQYVGMTLEMGHVPTEGDIAAASEGGCCGGGGGGGCGC